MRNSMKLFIMIMVLVAMPYGISFANTVDSVQVADSSGNNTWVLVNQNTIDSLTAAGNIKAADLVKTALAKVFNLEVDSVATELKGKSVTEVVDWIDTKAKGVAALRSYGVGQRNIDMNADVDEFKWMVRDASLMMAMIKKHTVELNGPTMQKVQAMIDAKADDSEMVKTQEAVNLTFQIAANNAGNIETLACELNQVKSNVWKTLEAIKLAKLRGNQGGDNKKLMEKLNLQVDEQVTPVKLTEIELPADTN